MTSTMRLLTGLPAGRGDMLMRLSHDVHFPQDARIFEEGSQADTFWIIHTGTVALDLYVPGRRRVVVDTLGVGDLLGWSWVFPPHQWHFGAEAFSPVRAHEFDAAAVRALCEDDPVLGYTLTRAVARILGRRLEVARTKLLDHYMVHGGAGL
ncbi:cyclic nucleotide-binding domain-containing protein [Streptomyces corynorhini]|uniref:Cyclic nucleotide-binding domain-containing protein n=2 Tax=Streptomyces corynorhini TaxID=2282652 RepID=A0A370B3F8_9ACTN|nr:cyclic nucleotide-binding domain-containing protein [Streptomyces corynorhini]RDG36350.1 cyclic nucleotide-binding domain-containing protein [Streptomyces corynorhini]